MMLLSNQERPERAKVWALCLLSAALAVVTSAAATSVSPPPAGRPRQTAIVDPAVSTGPNAATGLDRAAAAGMSAIKVPLFWSLVAPAKRPRTFHPADPSDPAYNWTGLDTQLGLIHSHGLEPIVYIAAAPTWAYRKIDGFMRPDPAQFAAFARAAVRRYSGRVPGLPRVRVWEAWNEPNKVPGPEFKRGAASWYRSL